MNFFRNTYLSNLWNHSKWLFGIVLIFIIGQSFFTYKGIQNFPFYHWGMYSGFFPEKQSYVVYELHLNGERYDKFSKPTTMRDDWYILLNRYDRVDQAERNIDLVMSNRFEGKFREYALENLKSRIKSKRNIHESFPIWFEHYVRESLNQEFDELEVHKARYEYDLDRRKMIRTTSVKLF